ncbi:glutamate-5-semialdehyde dehydrogenase [Sulfobacillus harzensis]|uniref:Gamma-glutamyl phosphate reductase n=1 Tax=Sulfobacillus harzensis TaxID=2729629 RepID=A0A7Y0L383_9FIRM|nr:glutamate-5-semialdehyde dehydrogenase [Sulfobacillus harzensis]NMP22390.1 glutamate-5-semialdehyde dehydrogenase [Sulfobacillus harzensis]
MLTAQLADAKQAGQVLAMTPLAERNALLESMEHLLVTYQDQVLAANARDVDEAQARDLDPPRIARLKLTPEKLAGLRESLAALRQAPDPLGAGRRWQTARGLILQETRVPLGVIAIIYESRPGVTVEATGLAIKSGNAILLRGGREAHNSNEALASLWHQALKDVGWPSALVTLLHDPDRSLAQELMHLKGLDLLIPRGGAGLIQRVVSEATVPVIETGVGNCHLYVDEAADWEMALNILQDGKISSPAVCNALETVLIHRAVKDGWVPQAHERLSPYGVVWHGDAEVMALVPDAVEATEADWQEEYLGLHLAARVVDSLDDALDHIARYGSHHSEAIVTNSYSAGQRFLAQVDAAVVYWNASTRFSDGFQFGYGGEMGISTQKLHARGPMGPEALTTVKTIAYGSGHTRDM